MSENKHWFLDINGTPKGPYSTAQIKKALRENKITEKTMAYKKGSQRWEPVLFIPELRLSQKKIMTEEAEPVPTYHYEQLAHEIDFAIEGDESQFVIIELDKNESVVAEAGSMMFMDASIQMETVFGDGSEAQRGSSKIVDTLLGAGKRLLTGESLFMTVFTNFAPQKQRIAFAAPYPGKIIPMNLAEFNGRIICQKDAFLCAAKGISIGIAFQKKIGVGLFGMEGFIMQKLEGDGLAFVHAGGTVVNRQLAAGETIKVDTGCIVALESSIDYDIEYVGNIKSSLFGGEGFFYATLTGPGNVWLQSLPLSRLAGRIYKAAPQLGGNNKGEGSILGTLGDIGDMFDR